MPQGTGTINLYETRHMVPLLNELFAPTTFFDQFFTNTVSIGEENVDIDIRKGVQRIVPYVRPIQEGVLVETGGFMTNTYKLPYIRVKTAAEADKYINRLEGDTPYISSGMAAQAANRLAMELQELKDMVVREEERQRAEAVFTGKVTMRNENLNPIQQVDFQLPSSHNINLTGTNRWNDPAQNWANIIEALIVYRALVVHDSGVAPTDIVVAPDVAVVLRNLVRAAADNLQLGVTWEPRIELRSRPPVNNVTFVCTLNQLGVDVWSYDAVYLDLDGTEKSYVPAGTISMLSRNARFDKYYGAIKNFHANFAAVPYYPHIWITEDGRARYLQLEGAPLHAPHQVDSIFVAKVLNAA